MVLTKKQKNTQLIFQLYQYFISPKRRSRDIFENTLQELNLEAYEIGTILCRIRDEGILNLKNFSLILSHSSPFEISSGLIQLHRSNLLTTENRKALEGHVNPSGVALVLRLLNSVNLLSVANRTTIQKEKNLHLLANVFFKLFYANLFTQKNFDKVMLHPNLRLLSNKLHGFNRKNNLTQTQFEQLIESPQEKISLSHDLNEPKKITFPRLIDRCRTSLFYAQKQQQDSETLCQSSEGLRAE